MGSAKGTTKELMQPFPCFLVDLSKMSAFMDYWTVVKVRRSFLDLFSKATHKRLGELDSLVPFVHFSLFQFSFESFILEGHGQVV